MAAGAKASWEGSLTRVAQAGSKGALSRLCLIEASLPPNGLSCCATWPPRFIITLNFIAVTTNSYSSKQRAAIEQQSSNGSGCKIRVIYLSKEARQGGRSASLHFTRDLQSKRFLRNDETTTLLRCDHELLSPLPTPHTVKGG